MSRRNLLSRVGRWLCGAGHSRKRMARRRPHWKSSQFSLLRIECLEARAMLSTVTWNNPAGGNWDVAANWTDQSNQTHHVPGSGDDVQISTTAAATVTIQGSDVESVNSLSTAATDTLSFSSGSLSVAVSSTLNGNLQLINGTLNVASGAVLTLAGTASTWSNCTLSGAFAGSGSGTVTLTGIQIGTGGAAFDFSGNTLQWTNFGINLNGQTLTNTGTIAISGGGTVVLTGAGTLANQGTIDVAGANLQLAGGCLLDNPTGASLDIQTGGGINTGNGGGTLSNEGTIAMTGTGTSTFSGINLVNNGAVNAVSGTLALAVGTLTSTSGTFNASQGAVLYLAKLGGGSAQGVFTGSGQGTVSVDGMMTLSGPSTFNFPASLFQLNVGDSGINLNGQTLTNTGTIVTSSPGGADAILNGPGTLANQGTIDVAGASPLQFSGGCVLDNQAGATLDVQTSGGIVVGNGGGTLSNEGTIAMTGTGTSTISGINLVNNGAVNAVSGTLALAAATLTSTSGTFNASQGAVLYLAKLGGGSAQGVFTGSGQGTVSVDGMMTLSGPSTFNFPASLFQLNVGDSGINLNGQTLTNTGTIVTSSPGGADAILNGPGTLANQGTIDVAGASPLQFSGGCVLDNQAGATLDIQTSGGIATGNNGGTLSNEGTISMTGTGTATVSGINLANSATINVASGTLSLSPASGGTSTGGTVAVAAGASLTVNSGTFSGDTFTVAAGDTIAVGGASLAGVTVFNVAQGATVGLGGGTVVSGTLTGSGAGAVDINNNVAVGLGGATFNFPGSLLQWTAGLLSLASGNVTNLGTINLAGSNDKVITNDGTFDNFGAILQTGTGSLGLHSDNVSLTTLDIEPGASYLLESDSGVNNDFGGVVALVNEGKIVKTAGSGTSTLQINGALSNGGTIEADSGTLLLNANSIAQVSGSTLDGGAWNAMNGATLQLPNSTAVTSNAGSLALSGAGAKIVGIAGLTSNSGAFVVSGGAAFTTAGNFVNNGSLTAGAGSTISVSGNFTQTSAGTLGDQIGGSPASGQFGRVAVTKAAALAGAFDISVVNSFSPSSGQQYAVMTFASASGSFANFLGMRGRFTESLSSTALDLNASAGAVDLAASSVTAPTMATSGQQITVNWQVTNQSSLAASGSWQDSVYLSPTSAISSQSVLLGAVQHSGGLGAGASYSGSLTAALPAIGPGNYYLLVDSDSLYQTPDSNRANNVQAAGTGQLQVGVPALTLGTPLSDAFTAAGQDHYYQVSVPAGGSLVVALASSASSGGTALYVSQEVLPTAYDFDQEANVANQPSQTLTVPQVTAATTFYILAHSVSGAAATAGFTITATQTAALTVSANSPASGGNGGNVTIEIDGTNFTPAAKASLALGGTTINASAIEFISASQIYATFNLAGAALGAYTLSVQSVNAPGTFQVVAANDLPLSISLTAPSNVRSGRTGTLTVSYANPSNNDIVAPLLAVSSTSAAVLFSTPDDPNDYLSNALVLAVATSGPAGILRPGEGGQLTVTLLSNDTIDGDQIPVQVRAIEAGQNINWTSSKAQLQPPGMSAAVWNVVFANFLNLVGTTSDSLNAVLSHTATYLSGLGEGPAEVSNMGSLMAFLLYQADAALPVATLASSVDVALPTPKGLTLAIDRSFQSSIEGRNSQGVFGLGWDTSCQTSLSTDSSGNVTIDSGGAFSYFRIQANGSYLDTDGQYGTLTQSVGAYTFTNTSGTQYVFLPSGFLNYEQDTDGNRITLGYNSGNQPVTLTYSNPSDPSEPTAQLSLTYNSQGFVSQVADGSGAVWTYAYDSAGHLLSVTAPGPTAAGLKTAYAYDTGSNPETANSLLSITNPDGSVENFTYDALGRLIGASANGGALATTYAYPGGGEVEASDSAGHQTTVWYNELAEPRRAEDSLGGISSYVYDSNGNLVKTTDPAGNTYQYSYDTSGNLTQSVNPLGQTTNMTYGSLSNLTSITDAGGNTTGYSYDSAGNLLSITYPDGTRKSSSYDPLGDPTETTLQNGDPISSQYNAQGLITQASFADGTHQAFTYNAHGDLLTASSYAAGGSLIGTTTQTYNAADELTSIAYPGGQSLTYTYNAQGQRTTSVDQSGYTLTYGYDNLGRLTGLSDGSGMVVTYTYNSLGQLGEKQNNNGTYTTYAYDANGDLTSEINYANSSGATVNSSFTYTYNALGEATSVTDAGGNVTSYGYDPLGQLTHVRLPGGQTITYVYNAAGDRTEVINNGATTTNYSSNADNEVTQVGSATYSYDANGNLHTVTDATGTTTYVYNDLNQLLSITASNGTVTTFQYSPLGFMTGMTVNGTKTNYLVDPTGLGNVAASYNGSGALVAHYNIGLGLASQTGPSGVGYYDFDAGGNTIGITGGSGTYVNQYSYLSFGETTTTSAALPNPFTFVGQAGVMQIGASLFSMRARNYTPATGQFLSNDPLGLLGGLNLHAYAGNDPVNKIDPSGYVATFAQEFYLLLRIAVFGTFPGVGNSYTLEELVEIATEGGLDVAAIAAQARAFCGEAVSAAGQAVSEGGTIALRVVPKGITVAVNGAEAGAAAEGGGAAAAAGGAGAAAEGGGAAAAAEGAGAATGLGVGATVGLGVASFGVGYAIGTAANHYSPTWTGRFGDFLFAMSNAFSSGTLRTTSIGNRRGNDPNAIIGPAGYGSPGFIQQPTGGLPYRIEYENDGSAATQDVTVTAQLDANLDWSSLQFGAFGFGPIDVTVPAGLTQYRTTVSYENSDGSSLDVAVALDFDTQTGQLTATYTSLDPATGQAPDGVFDGFLYPDNSQHAGEGYVQYTVQAKPGLASGAAINQAASVVFDTNAPIVTNPPALNTIDVTPPTSSVNPLPTVETSSNFNVSWSGQDNTGGSGIASYDVYVSDNGGTFTKWQSATTQTSATYTGVSGHTYGFYSVATDNVGNVQPTPTSAQATTTAGASSGATIGSEIIDNSQPGFWASGSGTWTTVNTGLNGTSLLSATTPGSMQSQAAWWFSMPAGVYEISITYTAGSNLTKDMGLDLYDGVGNWIGEIPVNEQVAPNSFTEDGVAWEDLGAFKLTSDIFHVSTWNSQTDGAIEINGIQLQAAPIIDDSNVANAYKNFPPAASVGTFSTGGSWTTSGQGAYGGSHVSAGTAGSGSSVATWTMPVTPGSYEVDVTWPSLAGLSASAAYVVYDGTTKLGSVAVNQQNAPSGVSYDGVTWQSLGSFTISAAQLTVTLANTAADGQVDADAIRIVPAYQPTPIVASNGYPGFWSNTNWTTQNAGLYGMSMVSDTANGSKQSQAAWWFPVQPGQYEVDVTWVPGSNLSPTAPFDVYNALTYISEPMVDETKAPVGVTDQGVVWQSLGTFTMTSDVLHVSTWNSQTNGAMCVNGIRIVPVNP